MNLSPEAQAKVSELQIIEQNLQSLLMQKQQIQIELSENNNALEEVKKSSEPIYRLIGSVLILAEKEKTIVELNEKIKILSLRMNSFQKQESLFEGKAKEIQSEIRKIIDGESTAKN
jgi:prefoldin beta subunit